MAERLFMNCYVPPAVERELWITDGTFSGSQLVKDTAELDLSGMKDLDGLLYFETLGDIGSTVWRSDGTEAGTYQLSTLAPALEASMMSGSAVSGGVLYFTGFTTATGWEPSWRTDGTAAGTFMLGDLFARHRLVGAGRGDRNGRGGRGRRVPGEHARTRDRALEERRHAGGRCRCPRCGQAPLRRTPKS